MISNYFKTVARNTKKHPLYVLINIFGLAGGMADSIVNLLFVKHELSCYGYHEHADRIVGVVCAWFNETEKSACTSDLLHSLMRR